MSANTTTATPTPPFDLVLFGGTGDLAMRKLLPALYQAHRDGVLHPEGRIIAAARSELDTEGFRNMASERCREHIRAEFFQDAVWNEFLQRLVYLQVDARQSEHFRELAALLEPYPQRVRVFYLSTGPDLFAPICQHIAAANLVTSLARVAVEKPLGHDLASAKAINDLLAAVFPEPQIYRIDHYLGKETVQNLMALRFGNTFFEPLWQRGWVSHVQITVAEHIGVEGRGEFYDHTGALRDMVQNHLLQTLCIVAMEPPTSMDPDAVRNEKLKVLHALKPITAHEVSTLTVRGQYRAGASRGVPVPGYREEPGIPADSLTETFVALKAELNNWRWAGVPFYLRTGKRLQERVTEIVIYFRQVPVSIFPSAGGILPEPNRLVIRLQPEESVKLYMMAKEPGDGMRLKPVHLNLDFATTFKTRKVEAYERLLLDVLRGRPTLFLRRDELEAAWRWVEPILHAWADSGEPPKPYTAGSWGPAASSALISRDGFSWHEES
ncbi:MAG TPA: glucose-6-phosphate dehydrogenase [Candidatus Competibacteraceae bacterium]|nr:glucose-6-phosphate dehydrogenase [Candidatus Competibacteraceae bacterium]